MSLRIWGSIGNIEYISFSEKYREQSMNVCERFQIILNYLIRNFVIFVQVIRKSFFQYEAVSIGSEINKSLEGQRDLEMLCGDVLNRGGVSLIARDVLKDLIVGVAFNIIQVSPLSDS